MEHDQREITTLLVRPRLTKRHLVLGLRDGAVQRPRTTQRSHSALKLASIRSFHRALFQSVSHYRIKLQEPRAGVHVGGCDVCKLCKSSYPYRGRMLPRQWVMRRRGAAAMPQALANTTIRSIGHEIHSYLRRHVMISTSCMAFCLEDVQPVRWHCLKDLRG